MAESDPSNETRIFERPAEAEEGSATAPPQGPPPPPTPPAEPIRAPLAAVSQPSAPPRSAFAPPLSTEQRRTATRRTLPTLITAAVIVADTAALVVYFTAIQ